MLQEHEKEQFISTKVLYESLNQAIRLAKEEGCTDSQIKPLVLKKQQYKEQYRNGMQRLLKAMPLSQNVVEICDGWYGIRYLNEKADMQLMIELIAPTDVYMLKRDGRHERELTRDYLESLLPSITDMNGLELYKNQLKKNARVILRDELSIVVTEPENIMSEESNSDGEDDNHSGTVVSDHARLRYTQRIIGIANEKEAREHIKNHTEDLNKAIMEGYENSEKVWEDTDGVEYWFDSNNIMYVVGNNKIITLYEEDFGFTKDINRLIVLEQLKVLRQSFDDMVESEEKAKENMKKIQDEVDNIESEIEVLESKIAMLTAERTALVTKRDSITKEVSHKAKVYSAEFNKLFGKEFSRNGVFK